MTSRHIQLQISTKLRQRAICHTAWKYISLLSFVTGLSSVLVSTRTEHARSFLSGKTSKAVESAMTTLSPGNFLSLFLSLLYQRQVFTNPPSPQFTHILDLFSSPLAV